MASEESNTPAQGEGPQPPLTVEEEDIIGRAVIPYVADKKALGQSDEEIQAYALKHLPLKFHRLVDVAINRVTEAQIEAAREKGIKSTVKLIVEWMADGWTASEIEDEADQVLPWMKEAMKLVTPEIVEGEKPRRNPNSPSSARIKADELLKQLKRQPGYESLTREEQELAERILPMRWDEKNYVTIRFLCGGRSTVLDPGNLERFNRAWVVTNFVKAEMRLAGKELPRPRSTGRPKSKRKPDSQGIYWEEMFRDVGVMRLWTAEGNCVVCGKLVTGDWIQNGVDMSHEHADNVCPVCVRRFGLDEGVSVQYWLGIETLSQCSQRYCVEHRPHLTDKREISVEAQGAFLQEMAANADRESQKAKEKREQERREQLRRERQDEQEPEREYREYHYDEDEERERRLEDPDWR